MLTKPMLTSDSLTAPLLHYTSILPRLQKMKTPGAV
jgi:hypothetical protein